MSFPESRPRRLRASAAIRNLVGETTLTPCKLIQPVFVVEGNNVTDPISAMQGQSRYSVDRITDHCKEVAEAGVSTILLFGIPDHKDENASAAYAEDGIVQRAVSAIKKSTPELLVMTDVCLCAYMSHGHCGVVEGDTIHNDATLDLLVKTALSHASAGADFVAPSDMMDGRVLAIRDMLDDASRTDVGIISYAVKYASAFYGPFREAADCAPQFGDRRTYQMDPANAREAERVAILAEEEGADILMVKPAMPSLDIIHRVRNVSRLPLAAYHVSGEYAMIEAAGAKGWIDRDAVVREALLSIRRAGADIIITYYAKEFARSM